MPDDLNEIKVSLTIGNPVKSSKSPVMHTAGYKALGIEKQFVFLAAEVKKEDLEKTINALRKDGIAGASITMPYKEEVIKYIDVLDDDAEEIGAVNTILNDEGELVGLNTDWIGAIRALEKRTNLKDKKVAVIGAGGAAKAIIFGLVKKEAEVIVINRTKEKAEDLAKQFDVSVGEMEDLKDCDIIINATSVGMNSDETPVNKELLNDKQIVFDVVYSPKETTLIKEAKEKGAKIIYGYEMLLYQGVEQFRLFTKYEAPVKEMEKALLESLN